MPRHDTTRLKERNSNIYFELIKFDNDITFIFLLHKHLHDARGKFETFCQQHVEVTVDHTGEPAIFIQLPCLKNQRGDVSETWITGEAYRDVKAWIDRRRVIFREVSYFFVTNTGKKISSPSIDMSLKTLCHYAGYWPHLFSAHSCRMGFASRGAARTFCDGGTINDTYARMGATGLWAPRSEAIERYCDARTKRFFEGPGRLTWDQFQKLSPEVMHGLEPLERPLRREAAWFHQDNRVLRSIGRDMGKEFPEGTSQYRMRLFIGKTIFNRDECLRQWLRDY